MVMIDETEGIEFDSDGRGCSVTLLTEDGQSLRGLADRAGIWTELEERHPGLTPERILQGDHAVFGCIVIHDNLRAHGEFGMEFDGDAAFGRFELTDVELNMLGKKLPRLADTDELKAFFSHAGGGGDRLTQSERSTAYGRHEPDANTVSDISEYLKDALTEYRNAPSWMRRDPWSDDPIEKLPPCTVESSKSRRKGRPHGKISVVGDGFGQAVSERVPVRIGGLGPVMSRGGAE